MKRSRVSKVIILVVTFIAILILYAPASHADEEYTFITKWGSWGSGDGQFGYPEGIAVDSSGNIYVTDLHNYRIQKFNSSGAFITKWGSFGSGDGQFGYPAGIAVDSSGNVYVVDVSNRRIQKFNSSGAFITKWGSEGSGNGQFTEPIGIAVDSSGNVYVTEFTIHRIQKFDSSGAFITKWGSQGSGDGQFYDPNGIAVDSSGNVYVTDTYRIQKFDSSGAFITKWGSQGSGDGQFNVPQGIAVDSSGNVYVADSNNDRIQKFDSSGAFITKWGSEGSGDGQFDEPNGIAVDSSGNVYVADSNNDRIQKFALLTVVDGVCGPANGGTFPSAPTTNLCSVGTPSAVTGSGPWTWTCDGLNGGTDASCSADLAGTTCGYTVSTPKPAKYKGGTVSLKVVASDKSCAAPNVVNTSGWMTSLPITWSNGKGTLKITAEPNDVASERSAEITIGDTPVTITQQAAPCKISTFNPKKGVIASAGGIGSFTFSLAQGCGWTAAPDEKGALWLTLDIASGDGSGEIGYSAPANTTGKALSGKINVTVTSTGKAKKYSVKQEN